MDRKSVIILALCGVLFVVWSILTPKLYPPKPVQPTNAAVSGGTSGPPSLTTTLPPTPTPIATLPDGFTQPASTEPEQLLVVSNGLVRLTFTSHGGGLKVAELVRHRSSVSCSDKKLEGYTPVTLNGPARVPVLALTGSNALTGDGVFRLSKFSRPASTTTNGSTVVAVDGIRAEKLLSNGVFVVKEFELSDDYLIKARIRFENRGNLEVAVPPQNWMVGAATPLSSQDDEQSVGLFWSDGSKATQINNSFFENRTLGCLPGTPRAEYSAVSPSVKWAAAKNQFFFIAVMPEVAGIGVAANKFTIPPPRSDLAANARPVTNQYAFNVVLSQSPTNLAAGGVLERNFDIYAGPKEYRRLERLAADMKNDVDKIMEFGFFGFFSRLLLLSMNGLNSLGLSYALAIIAITVIIKLLFWPLTQASTRSMKRMQTLQPQMKAIQEKYKDDPTKMNKRMMEFMREHKVSPLGGCLPLLLQIPVFIGFFQMVRTAIELRGAGFLWACDLSSPDTIFVIPGLNFNVNPLPLLMGATMFWQARLTPPAPGMDPMQQKIMKYFPLFFLFLLYNYSAGLTLYWTVQNLLSIAQTKLTKTTEAKKIAEPAKPVSPPAKRRK